MAKKVFEIAPKELKEFMEGVSEDEICFYSVFPDVIDKDNLDNGYWMHSRKMILKEDKSFSWVHGSVALAIGGLRWNFRTHYKQGNFKEARYDLIKMTHYCVDSCTVPHLVYKKADFLHSKFERDFDESVVEILKRVKLKPKSLMCKSSVYDSVVKQSEYIFSAYADTVINCYDEGMSINDFLVVRKNMLIDILQFVLDCVWYTFRSVSDEFKTFGGGYV